MFSEIINDPLEAREHLEGLIEKIIQEVPERVERVPADQHVVTREKYDVLVAAFTGALTEISVYKEELPDMPIEDLRLGCLIEIAFVKYLSAITIISEGQFEKGRVLLEELQNIEKKAEEAYKRSKDELRGELPEEKFEKIGLRRESFHKNFENNCRATSQTLGQLVIPTPEYQGQIFLRYGSELGMAACQNLQEVHTAYVYQFDLGINQSFTDKKGRRLNNPKSVANRVYELLLENMKYVEAAIQALDRAEIVIDDNAEQFPSDLKTKCLMTRESVIGYSMATAAYFVGKFPDTELDTKLNRMIGQYSE